MECREKGFLFLQKKVWRESFTGAEGSRRGKLGRGNWKWQENPIYMVICSPLMWAGAWAGPTDLWACGALPDSPRPALGGCTAVQGLRSPGSVSGWACGFAFGVGDPGCRSGRPGKSCQAGEKLAGAAGCEFPGAARLRAVCAPGEQGHAQAPLALASLSASVSRGRLGDRQLGTSLPGLGVPSFRALDQQSAWHLPSPVPSAEDLTCVRGRAFFSVSGPFAFSTLLSKMCSRDPSALSR